MAGILVFGLVEEGRLTASSLEAVSFANHLSDGTVKVTGALMGSGIEELAKQFSTGGMTELLTYDDPILREYLGDVIVPVAESAVRASAADIIIVPPNVDVLEWVPRLAARLDAALATECLKAELTGSGLRATRAIAGGSLHATYHLDRPIKMIVLGGGPQAVKLAGTACPIRLCSLPPEARPITTELLESVLDSSGGGPPLKTAKIVVAGGMGVGSASNWKLIDEAAAALGAAVGASRAAVDVGWAPSNRQVGFSGMKIKPDLYIAVGISGAIHHLAGIGGAKRVVAINKDPESSIFRAAHLGVVGDWHKILPSFIARVQELKAD